MNFYCLAIPQFCENMNGGCDHFCHVENATVKCSCADGYTLLQGQFCHSDGTHSFIHLFIHEKNTKEYHLHTSSISCVVNNLFFPQILLNVVLFIKKRQSAISQTYLATPHTVQILQHSLTTQPQRQ